MLQIVFRIVSPFILVNSHKKYIDTDFYFRELLKFLLKFNTSIFFKSHYSESIGILCDTISEMDKNNTIKNSSCNN